MEELSIHNTGCGKLRLITAGECEMIRLKSGHFFETVVVFLPSPVISPGNADVRSSIARLSQPHQPLGIRIRKWFQKYRVYDAEDCGVGADSQHQGQNDNQG